MRGGSVALETIIDLKKWGGGDQAAVGDGYNWTYKGRFYSILYTRAGMYRGNHIHPNKQRTLLLDGKGKYIFKVDGEEVSKPLKIGEILEVPAGVPHILIPEEDCLSVEWWDGLFEAEEFDFPHFTSEIKKRIEEYNKWLQEVKQLER